GLLGPAVTGPSTAHQSVRQPSCVRDKEQQGEAYDHLTVGQPGQLLPLLFPAVVMPFRGGLTVLRVMGRSVVAHIDNPLCSQDLVRNPKRSSICADEAPGSVRNFSSRF